MKEQSRYRPKLRLAIFLLFVALVQATGQDRAKTARVTNDENGIVDNIYLITVTVSLGNQTAALILNRLGSPVIPGVRCLLVANKR